MKIELRNVKYAAFASTDSNCFEATVYVDGERAFTASDDGNGGCIDFRILNQALYDNAKAFVEALPPYVSPDFTLPYNLELYVGELLEKWLFQKWLRKVSKTKTLFTLPGDGEGEYRSIKHPYDERVQNFILAKYPTATIIRPE